jgi:hypothetical protein
MKISPQVSHLPCTLFAMRRIGMFDNVQAVKAVRATKRRCHAGTKFSDRFDCTVDPVLR